MDGNANELGDKWTLRIYFSHLSNLISRYIYIYIYTEVVEACSCADILHLNGGRREGNSFSRENHARPAKSALTKMSLAAGTSRTHPFVSILCQVPIRAVSRTALYNEGTRRKGENGAHREKKGWRKREREGRRA